ncbi:hypothetical protein BDV27DRAFT_120977 [Aspergillus caelatus]|uniref:Uncharacterized protein n=1 Tax=Aspergillus caelatus TaxID=61420 RepID=A0A5N7AJR7_9EURO|nr:uncharacterized protein BDV27DRAFT_120977 [Aspergillus caelatus]KAE8369436.1 hypothetical protein BDV27DRAFT_120977 [Aspergillus caelatus]
MEHNPTQTPIGKKSHRYTGIHMLYLVGMDVHWAVRHVNHALAVRFYFLSPHLSLSLFWLCLSRAA